MVVFSAAASLAYLAVSIGGSWESLLMLGVLVIFIFKHFEDLRTLPHARGRLGRWLHIIIRGTQLTI